MTKRVYIYLRYVGTIIDNWNNDINDTFNPDGEHCSSLKALVCITRSPGQKKTKWQISTTGWRLLAMYIHKLHKTELGPVVYI